MSIITSALKETNKSETLLINEISKERETQGDIVYKLGFGQSPFLPPPLVINALKSEAHRKEYMSVQGLLELREAAVDCHRRLGHFESSADQAIVGPGSKMLIYCVMAAFKKADIFLVTPSWVSYGPQAHLAGHNVTRIETTYKQRWRLTPEALEAACKARPEKDRPLIMVLNYPGNPDGLTYTASELESLAVIARAYNIIIISDEIYGILTYNKPHVSIAQYYPEGTIVTSGLSKWCGAGGWRLGIAFIPKELGPSFKACLLGIASETYSCVASPIQCAGVRAYQWDDEIASYVAHQRRILEAIGTRVYNILKADKVLVHQPEGGFYLNPDFSEYQEVLAAKNINNSQALCNRLLDETGVALLPGSAFGYSAERLVTRLAFVDFDGENALAKSALISGELPDTFVETIAPKLVEGVTKIGKWLRE